jgi:nicotinate phosphoribosyltransferase
MAPGPALLVDLYELTMLEAYRREGIAQRPATFSCFVRSLPAARSYLVAAGLDDCLAWLEDLRFDDDDLAALGRLDLFPAEFCEWLGSLRFTGTVRAVREGTLVFGGEPVLEVTAPVAEAQLAETFLLNQITVQTVLATKAARVRHAAGDRAVVDFALRRCQGVDAAMKLVRVGRLVGLAGTSNVAGADRYHTLASGTMAHSFVQAYEHELDAFRSYADAFGDKSVLLVDTYDSRRGIDRAVQVARECHERGIEIAGLRLDSGDLLELSYYARERLDAAGLVGQRVYASGGLDEHDLYRLVHVEHAPIDAFGVGSSLGVSADAPTLDTVYKLVEFDGRPVRKRSTGKETWPGPKQVWRAHDWSHDVLALADEPPRDGYRPLLETVMEGGRRVAAGAVPLEDAAAYFAREWERVPEPLLDLETPAQHRVDVSAAVRDLAERLDRDALER